MKVIKRSDIELRYKWNLSDIYKDDSCFYTDIDDLNSKLENVDKYKNKLDSNSTTLYTFLNMYESISQKFEKIYAYATLKYCEDTKNVTSQAMYQKANAEVSIFSSKFAFMNNVILNINDSKIDTFISQNSSLKKYKTFIDDIKRTRGHILSDKEETLLAKMNDLLRSSRNIFNSFNNADIKFNDVKDSKNVTHKLTHGNYIKMLKNSDRVLRKNAFLSMYSKYDAYKNTLAEIMLTNLKKDVFLKNARKYNSSLEYFLDQNNIDTKVYDNIIKAVDDSLPCLYNYFEIKKKYLKLDSMHLYDVYLNISNDVPKEINYNDAKDIVLNALSVLGVDYNRILKKALDSRWIDVYETGGKRSGGFSLQVYGVHPYILLNYNNTIDDVSTLAHELGHTIHSYYTINNQPYIYSNYSIFVAEIASTVNECLLSNYLLKNTTDKNTKIYLLSDYIERVRATIYRQTMFAEFEKIIHQKIEQGMSVTIDDLCSLYYTLNQKYFGSNVVIDEQIKMEWARIPHFYNSFYVYQYATGMSCAIYISNKILQNDQDFIAKYIDFLKSGNSMYPLDLLKKLGLDLSETDVFKQAMNVFKAKIIELKNLLGD